MPEGSFKERLARLESEPIEEAMREQESARNAAAALWMSQSTVVRKLRQSRSERLAGWSILPRCFRHCSARAQNGFDALNELASLEAARRSRHRHDRSDSLELWGALQRVRLRRYS